MIGGIIILVIERYKPRARYYAVDNIRYKTAFAIGCAQALAMVPGVSRSGATIMGSVLLGVERKAATEFSFFLAIPTMLGATLFDLYMNWQSLTFHSLEMIGIGFVCAFFAGLVVVKTLIAFISTHGFTPFAWYRIVVGLCMLYLFI